MSRVILAVVALLTLLARPTLAQPHHTMPVVVQADRVLIGTEFMPRRLVDLALEAGGKDNVTVILGHYRIPGAV